jgi:hypothetical protein
LSSTNVIRSVEAFRGFRGIGADSDDVTPIDVSYYRVRIAVGDDAVWLTSKG